MFQKKIIKIINLTLTLLFLFTTIIFASDTIYVWSTESEPLTNETNFANNVSSISTNASTVNLALESGSAILIEQHSGKVLYEHNIHEKLRPASVTKIMSILLIMEAIDSGKLAYTDKIPCSETAASMGGSQIWLDTTETLTVDEMLKAICVVSANDCTVQK